MKKLCAVALMLLLPVSGAMATDSEDTAKSDKEKLICKTEKVTGSRVKSKRTCMTVERWEEVRASARQGVDDLVRSTGRNGGDVGGS